uniref:Uncharacterized protein n=1 Tax=Pipistrellus kuhlii TaxID=59472 RepID=A0A7J7YMH7_PIPKU|nr:hypothetical protein mPipKuh1_010129 [Pipistrellus kuhlii]
MSYESVIPNCERDPSLERLQAGLRGPPPHAQILFTGPLVISISSKLNLALCRTLEAQCMKIHALWGEGVPQSSLHPLTIRYPSVRVPSPGLRSGPIRTLLPWASGSWPHPCRCHWLSSLPCHRWLNLTIIDF